MGLLDRAMDRAEAFKNAPNGPRATAFLSWAENKIDKHFAGMTVGGGQSGNQGVGQQTASNMANSPMRPVAVVGRAASSTMAKNQRMGNRFGPTQPVTPIIAMALNQDPKYGNFQGMKPAAQHLGRTLGSIPANTRNAALQEGYGRYEGKGHIEHRVGAAPTHDSNGAYGVTGVHGSDLTEKSFVYGGDDLRGTSRTVQDTDRYGRNVRRRDGDGRPTSVETTGGSLDRAREYTPPGVIGTDLRPQDSQQDSPDGDAPDGPSLWTPEPREPRKPRGPVTDEQRDAAAAAGDRFAQEADAQNQQQQFDEGLPEAAHAAWGGGGQQQRHAEVWGAQPRQTIFQQIAARGKGTAEAQKAVVEENMKQNAPPF